VQEATVRDDRNLVVRGAIVTLALSLALAGILALLGSAVDGFEGSTAETIVTLLSLGCYAVGGFTSVDRNTESGARNGTVAVMIGVAVGMAAIFVLLVAFDSGPLAGLSAIELQAKIIGPFIFGALFGALVGWYAGRRVTFALAA
jgi:hypothetical protein